MCGIAGFWNPQASDTHGHLTTYLQGMSQALNNRGPDGMGTWVDPETQVGFVQRRLAIQDLSPAGRQPMESACGRYVIIYNGEVFNGDELRAHLAPRGISFQGHSDTEAILEGCAAWGVKATVKKLIGMFAFALWDKGTRTLYLVRDRLGIKPLYWGYQGSCLFFGSVVSSLLSHPLMKAAQDPEALKAFLLYGYIPAPLSIYQGIQKVMPGHMITLQIGKPPVDEAYWSLDQVIENAYHHPFTGTDQDAIEALDVLLKDAVQKRMLSDVPLGAFLSGGIDSSLVVALMQQHSTAPIKTFSIGFTEAAYDEAPYAKALAQHLGTEHHEHYFSIDQAASLVPNIFEWYDEPFADSSQLPTYLVSKAAKEHVTVSLSGDGGDELFAGYSRYHLGHKIWGHLGKLPYSLRHPLAVLCEKTPKAFWQGLNKILPFAPSQLALKVPKLARVLRCEHLSDFYQSLIWSEPQAFSYLKHPESVPKGFLPQGSVDHPVSQMQYWDTLTYLPDDILTKVDRASMAVSLEARVPLLDHRVVAFAWSLPHNLKVREGQGKWILRQVLQRYVPTSLTQRPKMGFGIPLGPWLKKDLKGWADDLLSVRSLADNPILDPVKVNGLWQDYCQGKHDQSYFLWTILMMQGFLKKK